MLHTNERLDFTRLAGLFTKLENVCRDLSGDLSGRRALTVPGLFDKCGMETQANQKIGSVPVSLKYRRRGGVQPHCLQHFWDASLVWPGLAARTPKHEDVLLLDDIRRNHRMVVGLHPMADFENLFLNSVQFAGRQSCRRQHGLSLILCDADENVAAAQSVKIVGEGAHRVEDGLPGAKITQIKELKPATWAKAKKWKWLLRPLEQFGSRSKLALRFQLMVQISLHSACLINFQYSESLAYLKLGRECQQ